MPVTVQGLALQQGVARALGIRPAIGHGQPVGLLSVLARPRDALRQLVTGPAPYTVAGCQQFQNCVHDFAGPVALELHRELVNALHPQGVYEGDIVARIGSYFYWLGELLRNGAGMVAGLPLCEVLVSRETVIDRDVAVRRLWRCALVTEVLRGPGRIVTAQHDVHIAADELMRQISGSANLHALSQDPNFVLKTEDWLPLMMAVYQDNDTVLKLITAGAAGELVRILHWLAWEGAANWFSFIPPFDMEVMGDVAQLGRVSLPPGADARTFFLGIREALGIRQFPDYPEHQALINQLASWCLLRANSDTEPANRAVWSPVSAEAAEVAIRGRARHAGAGLTPAPAATDPRPVIPVVGPSEVGSAVGRIVESFEAIFVEATAVYDAIRGHFPAPVRAPAMRVARAPIVPPVRPIAAPPPAQRPTASPPAPAPGAFAHLAEELERPSLEEENPYRDDQKLVGRLMSGLWVLLQRRHALNLQTDPRFSDVRAAMEDFATRVAAGTVPPKTVGQIESALGQKYWSDALRTVDGFLAYPNSPFEAVWRLRREKA